MEVLPAPRPQANANLDNLDGTVVQEAPALELLRIEEYRVLGLLGRGAMGRVYLAHDTVLDRAVAIKFLNVPHATPAQKARFLNEARALARLLHPNIVAVYRAGDHLGAPYLVSEYVRGTPLSEINAPLPSETVGAIAIGLCRGLQAAHGAGVLHRDLKPANALLGEDGRIKLLDFGLAKLVEKEPVPAWTAEDSPLATRTHSHRGDEQRAAPAYDPRATESLADQARPIRPNAVPSEPAGSIAEMTGAGARLGTPLYMAPEIWRGEPATLRSDLYSLGALLYELLAGGQPPYSGRTLADLEGAVLHAPLRPLASLSSGLPPGLAELIEQCLRREPKERPRSADELVRKLEFIFAPRRPWQIPAGNPYRGLRPFEAEHRACFFGRGQDLRDVLGLLRYQPLVLVTGDSGVGKSSLCRAGVLPALIEENEGSKPEWQALQLRPGRRPLLSLASLVAPLLSLSSEEALLLATREPASLVRALLLRLTQARNSPAGGAPNLVLFVDQLEELVTQSDIMEATQFGELLTELATPLDGIRVLATVRGDFLFRVLEGLGLRQELARGIYVLPPLRAHDLQEAIVGPARLCGVEFEDSARVDEMTESAARTKGGLPLLQFALAELWELRDEERRVIPATALSAIGGVAGALARHADATFVRFAPLEQLAARDVLCRLVGLDGVRTACRTDELLSGSREQTAARASALEALVQARLVTARQAGSDGAVYELAHEALVQGWSALRDWLDYGRERRALEQRLEAAAVEWERLKQPRECLWPGPRLEEASTVGLKAEALTPRGRSFLLASQSAVRKRRGARSLALVLTAGALIAAGPVVRAIRALPAKPVLARAEADFARAHRMAQEADRLRLQAYTSFDNKHIGLAEELWSQALTERQAALHSYEQAATGATVAVAIYKDTPGAAQLMTKVHGEQERFMIATLSGQPTVADPLQKARLQLELLPSDSVVEIQPADGNLAPRGFGKALYAGRSPIGERDYAAGSYLLTLRAPGRVTTQFPIFLKPGELYAPKFAPPPIDAVPNDFLYIPPGTFLYGCADAEYLRKEWFKTQPMHTVGTSGYLIGKYEVTYADWLVYLEALPKDERLRRMPEAGGRKDQSVWLERSADGRYRLTLQPNAVPYQAWQGEPLVYPQRQLRRENNWLRFPVSGISYEDALDYTRWLTASGRVPGARLCTEHEWERAARGADGRRFPHGDEMNVDGANFDLTYGQKPENFGPDEVGAHPKSQSPFGVYDMAGNVWEFVQSVDPANERVIRGGAFYYGRRTALSMNRETGGNRSWRIGLRVCADVAANSR